MKGIFELAGRQTPVLIFELETAREVSAGGYRMGESAVQVMAGASIKSRDWIIRPFANMP
ncbi:hypothetical protein IB265_15785 [Ensifer sp. ENS10]|uniref:hypothetical protein n=1 Tax=unclassified Ensifer TaxID=2633371 RepID=UPI001994FB38|nr:hypothetical protein [Ensifer sp. ENS10]MBD9508245.1 hypothetical protein [Ensifer sp. ENS10]